MRLPPSSESPRTPAPRHKKAAVSAGRRPTGSRRAVALAASAICTLAITATLGTSTSQALFTAGAVVGNNSVAADVLAAPGNLAVERVGKGLSLSWQPTPSQYADGYKIFRATASGGPWTEIASVTGRNTTAWSDDAAPQGTSYYQVKAFRVNWISGTTNVGEGTNIVSISDTFSGTGGLGPVESGGYAWTDVNGTWSRTDGDAATTTAAISNPMSVVETGVSDVAIDLETPVGSGESIYFRVADGNDWLRARARRATETYEDPIYGTEYQWQHANYQTEYQYQQANYQTEYQIAGYTSTYGITGYTPGPWGAYGDGYVCFSSTPVDRYEHGYLVFDVQGRGSSCSNRGGPGAYNYYVRSRSLTANYGYTNTFTGYYWSTSSYAPSPSYWTGSTRSSFSGYSYYWSTSPYGSGWTGSTRQSFTGYDYYWGASAQNSGDTKTGSTRTGVVGSETKTRTVFEVRLEQMVNGALSTLKSFASAQPTSLRVNAKGTTISVSANGEVLGTATTSTHQGATKHGVGLGGPSEAASDRVGDFSLVEQ